MVKIMVPLKKKLSQTVLVMLIWLTGYNWLDAAEIQTIDKVQVNPGTTNVNQSATVLVTVRIGVTSTLLPETVTLIRYDKNDKAVANLGRMYDDGTHGDALRGDNLFTTQITINESVPQIIKFKASVANRGVVRRTLSDETPFFVQSLVTPEQILSSIADDIEAGNIDNALKSFTPSSHNRDVLIGLNSGQRNQLASAFRNTHLITEDSNLKVYGTAWLDDDGTPLEMRISMSKTLLNEWFIISW